MATRRDTRPRIPCGRLRDGRLLVGLTPALLAALKKHGPQQLTRVAGCFHQRRPCNRG